MLAQPQKLEFKGASSATLAGRLDLPAGPVAAYALFAHCFTCTKDIIAARTIASALTQEGIAVLRFDFTGLGGSGGDFGSTNFSMNMGDLLSAVDFMRQNYQAPSLLVGHSLGGAAVISVASEIPEVKAIATIGAPSNTHHITAHFGDKVDEIREKGKAEVTLGMRPFTLQKQFLDDLDKHSVKEKAEKLKAALLIMHSPIDATVGIEHAGELFIAAKHPKSFITLDTADHLISDKRDAAYAARVIACWATRYLGMTDPMAAPAEHEDDVLVQETAAGKFQNLVSTGPHRLVADEPTDVGGLGTGPSPYDLLCAALGTCTTMTLRMYADRKNLPIERISCRVSHERSHDSQMQESVEGEILKPDVFTRTITLEGDLPEDVEKRVFEIADRCPVHRTLENGASVVTRKGTL